MRPLRGDDVDAWLALRREALRRAGRSASETHMALELRAERG